MSKQLNPQPQAKGNNLGTHRFQRADLGPTASRVRSPQVGTLEAMRTQEASLLRRVITSPALQETRDDANLGTIGGVDKDRLPNEPGIHYAEKQAIRKRRRGASAHDRIKTQVGARQNKGFEGSDPSGLK